MSKITIEIETRNPDDVADAFTSVLALYRRYHPNLSIKIEKIEKKDE